jgi:alanyl-tRNA synthetase
VRMVEVGDGTWSRELCGGTHVRTTAEIGVFKITSEASSSANVRRIEALTGPAAIDHYRGRSDQLTETGALLGSPRDALGAARRSAERLAELERRLDELGRQESGAEAERLGSGGEEVAGVRVIVAEGSSVDQRGLLDLADRVKQRAGDAAVVLGATGDGKVALVASFAPGAVERGLSAAEVVREAAAVVGGGGGGRDDVAQAGGREPERLGDALETAREAIRRALFA